MSNHKQENMNDSDFEAMLANSVSELPPDDIIAEVTPWKKSTNRVLVGLAMTTVTLNFWCLNYILPAIGTVLMLLGFRALRKDNKWFGACLGVTIVRAVYLLSLLIINTTIYQEKFYDSSISSVFTAANMLLPFIEFICLWRGFISVQKKAGLTPHAKEIIALIIWYAILCPLAFIQYEGFIIVGIMIIAYVFIIRNLYKLSKELDDAGYIIKPAPIKITDRCFVISLAAVLIIGGACGCIFGSSYPMEWRPINSAEHSEVEDIKNNLKDLGFPEYVLTDLSAEDIMSCKGALQVIVDTEDRSFNDENSVLSAIVNSDNQNIRLTGVGVQVPDDKEKWVIFHHFIWTENPKFYGTESIQLWSAYRNHPEGWAPLGDVTGRILYDKDGETYVADYYSLDTVSYESNDVFFGNQSNTDVFATYSMPNKGSNCRGYLSYSTYEVEYGYIINSWVNYTHQQSLIQYPVMTAKQKRMINSWNDAGVFRTIQSALQCYSTDEGVELID